MTFEKILDDVTLDRMTLKEARKLIEAKDKMKTINFFINRDKISSEPLRDGELQQVIAIAGILQILDHSPIGSPISDSNYDTLQEMLVAVGIPRQSGSIEINSASKVNHRFPTLRGTLDKVYYLLKTEKRTNKSRRYLDEWIRSMQLRYKKVTGKDIDLNEEKVLMQPKFDGVSVVAEIFKKILWVTRGHTKTNTASDVSHIMNQFDDIYRHEDNHGIKFEVMMTEENKDKINSLQRDKKDYKNSRQIVTSILNSDTADFKADYLYPVPLRIMELGSTIEKVHPDLIAKFPTAIIKLSDREAIKEFAKVNRWIYMNGMRFRTDGAVLTLINPNLQEILGRDNDTNHFEVAYKFTEEYAYTKVRDIEFYVSEFGFITPVLVVNDVILKGNTINRISLSNKERFDELFFSYGDDVKILYDIIPYATRDESCTRVKKGRKIEFISRCPKCHDELDLTATQVQCKNNKCPSRIIGRILNYCGNLRIQNIGYSTLEALYDNELLKKGILSLYKLKKKSHLIEEIDGFGRLKAKKIIAEIEAKRRLRDYEFFGAIGIEGLSTKSFQAIFGQLRYSTFIDLFNKRDYDQMMRMLMEIDGIAEKKAETLVNYLQEAVNRVEIEKLLEELSIYESISESQRIRGKIVFSGFRSEELKKSLEKNGWDVSDSWTNKTVYLIVPNLDEESTKVSKAKELKIPILTIDQIKALLKANKL